MKIFRKSRRLVHEKQGVKRAESMRARGKKRVNGLTLMIHVCRFRRKIQKVVFASTLLTLFLPLGIHAESLFCGDVGRRQTAAAYVSSAGKQLEACFDQDRQQATLLLPDGVKLTLPIALSASGVRYSDGKRVFWEHQGVARYFADDKLLFEGKTAPTAGYNSGVASSVLVKSTLTASGRPIVYPSHGKAEVTALRIDMAPGAETGWHKHATPVYAYVLSGAIEVEFEGGGMAKYQAGDAFIEVVDLFHNGTNRSSVPVSMIVFYTGVQGTPLVSRRNKH
jgi:quercetin dioxygenase-like cupin family protein/membrane-bound inhibitor of C-type lysozyme